MVTVKNFKTITKSNGEKFNALIVEGGVQPVLSQKTNRIYFTSRRAIVPCTLDGEACKTVIGMEFQGEVAKVACDPYAYTIEETGETIQLSHRWEYKDDQLEAIEKHLVKETEIIM
ncbi:hypothetical protein [Winogradskyella sp. 3972H.M.0a.05]|uniref:hypothetical protein n=1 Tax=Winogradskyella sp. 3972H.M.0a.05 TaxID=2950277 RepID=UPI0033977F0D